MALASAVKSQACSSVQLHSNYCSAVTAGKYGCHLWDISVAHTLSDEFLIVRGFRRSSRLYCLLLPQDSFFINNITPPVWALAKTSFFLMYLQLFGALQWVRYCCYFGLFACNAFYIGIFIPSVYYQAPGIGQTWQESVMNKRYLKIREVTGPPGNLALDVYIFIIPLVVVWNLHLSRSKKWGLVAVFGTGFM
jgi:hypothetical protein